MEEGENQKKAKRIALRMLAYRGRSRQEITDKLREKGFSPIIIEDTLDYLESFGYVNDQSFALELATALFAHKGWGFRRIVYTLRSRGIPADVVHDTIASLSRSHSEEETALAIVKRRFSHIDFRSASPKERQRVASFLQRRGYSWDTINRVMRS